jgi:hypothetical protein
MSHYLRIDLIETREHPDGSTSAIICRRSVVPFPFQTFKKDADKEAFTELHEFAEGFFDGVTRVANEAAAQLLQEAKEMKRERGGAQ